MISLILPLNLLTNIKLSQWTIYLLLVLFRSIRLWNFFFFFPLNLDSSCSGWITWRQFSFTSTHLNFHAVLSKYSLPRLCKFKVNAEFRSVQSIYAIGSFVKFSRRELIGFCKQEITGPPSIINTIVATIYIS